MIEITAIIVWIVLFIWGFKILSRKISEGFSNLIKNIPEYLRQYDDMRMKHYQIEKARGIR